MPLGPAGLRASGGVLGEQIAQVVEDVPFFWAPDRPGVRTWAWRVRYAVVGVVRQNGAVRFAARRAAVVSRAPGDAEATGDVGTARHRAHLVRRRPVGTVLVTCF